jgi:hypothetical protein
VAAIHHAVDDARHRATRPSADAAIARLHHGDHTCLAEALPR